MYKPEMSIYRAIVSEINPSSKTVYVKIPNVLGATVSIATVRPTEAIYGWTWDPEIGDQVLVAVEGLEFDKVYIIAVI